MANSSQFVLPTITAPAFSSGGVVAAAYTLDNRTQDAFAFVGQRQAP